jgi:excinuclease ABC subunit A
MSLILSKNSPTAHADLCLMPFPKKYLERTLEQELNLLLQKGYTRVQFGNETLSIQDILEGVETRFDTKQAAAYLFNEQNLRILIDRFVLSPDLEESDWMRLADSVNTAFYESEGECHVVGNGWSLEPANQKFIVRYSSFIVITIALN